MPQYFFRISQGRYAGASVQGIEFESHEAAWIEMRRICADLLGSVAHGLKQDTEWRMELLDAARRPVFRVRLVSESVDLPRHEILVVVPCAIPLARLSIFSVAITDPQLNIVACNSRNRCT